MDAKIQKWLQKYHPQYFADWKKGKYSQVILCTFEDWEKGKAKVHEAPGVKVERLFDEDGQNSSLILHALPPEEYEKISEHKRGLANNYVNIELERWKSRFKAGCIESKEPEWYLDQEIKRVTEALEDPEKGFFNSITGCQLVIGAKYSKTSDKAHPDHKGKTFNNKLAYYHYYTWKAPTKRLRYWDDLKLWRYNEWRQAGRQFNTVSMGCDAHILAHYRKHLKELKENPLEADAEPQADSLTTWQRCMYYRYLLEGGVDNLFNSGISQMEAYNELAKRHGGSWKYWQTTWLQTDRDNRQHEGKRRKKGLKKVLKLLEEHPQAYRICEMELSKAGIL